jgi:rubrerythrin
MNVLNTHADRMSQLPREVERLKAEYAKVQEDRRRFHDVLNDEDVLTDAMTSAVFKDKRIIDIRKDLKQYQKGKSTMTKERYDQLDTEYTEHAKWLRRFKGKKGSSLTAEERRQIEEHIRKLDQWLREHEKDAMVKEQEYIAYIQESLPIVEAYKEEETNVKAYIADEIAEECERYIDEATGQKRLTAPERLMIEAPKITKKTSIDAFFPSSNLYERSNDLQEEYHELLGKRKRAHYKTHTHCPKCDVEYIFDGPSASKACPQCGESVNVADYSLKSVPFSEPFNAPKTKNTYLKTTYYNKWKQQLMGTLNKTIPDDCLSQIYRQCHIYNYDIVDQRIIRSIMQELKMSQYFDLVPAITFRFNKVPLVRFTKEEEAELDRMFDEAIALYARCPVSIKGKRSNYISYPYHFYQCFRILGKTEYMGCVSLLKRVNLRKLDPIWKWICEHHQPEPWPYYPTYE